MIRTLSLCLGLLVALPQCKTSTTVRDHLPPLQPVARVDLQRYMGTWYEIASIPQSFQAGCMGTRATYTLKEGGEVEVINACRKPTTDGRLQRATGRARVVENTQGAQLKVSFFRPFWGDYWIVDLADDYSYAAVGSPGRDTLWILSRTPTLVDAVYDGILNRLRAKQYDVSRLVRTQQP
jgi:apolipoprotein D and lipocalin family protein